MLLNRFGKNIKNQNWFAVSIDILVVVIGVYLAVYIGQAETKRNEKDQALESLHFLHEDLGSDIKQIEDILLFRSEMAQTLALLIDALKQEPINTLEITKINQLLDTLDTPTFFPNKSSYILMLENGQLINIENNQLVRKITKLYEHGYSRNQVFSNLSDVNHDSILRNIRHRYFDRTTERLITENSNEIAILRSGLRAQKSYGDDYSNFIKNDILPLMHETKASIADYIK